MVTKRQRGVKSNKNEWIISQNKLRNICQAVGAANYNNDIRMSKDFHVATNQIIKRQLTNVFLKANTYRHSKGNLKTITEDNVHRALGRGDNSKFGFYEESKKRRKKIAKKQVVNKPPSNPPVSSKSSSSSLSRSASSLLENKTASIKKSSKAPTVRSALIKEESVKSVKSGRVSKKLSAKSVSLKSSKSSASESLEDDLTQVIKELKKKQQINEENYSNDGNTQYIDTNGRHVTKEQMRVALELSNERGIGFYPKAIDADMADEIRKMPKTERQYYIDRHKLGIVLDNIGYTQSRLLGDVITKALTDRKGDPLTNEQFKNNTTKIVNKIAKQLDIAISKTRDAVMQAKSKSPYANIARGDAVQDLTAHTIDGILYNSVHQIINPRNYDHFKKEVTDEAIKLVTAIKKKSKEFK